jgi:glycosyltransferase involved in cell wall biosynthesis
MVCSRGAVKILYQHRTSAQDGSATHIEGLVGALRGLGAEVIVVAPRSAARRAPHAARVARVRRALPRWLHELLEIAYNVPESWRLWRMIRAHRPDLVYERSNVFALSATLVAARCGLPRLIEVNAPYAHERAQHGGLALQRIANWSESLAWRRADAVIPVTGVLARIVERAGVPRERLHVMGNGIDPAHFAAPAASALHQVPGWRNRVVLGFTGFVRAWNRLDYAIDLLAEPGSEALALLVVGDGPARAELEARAALRRVADRVHFTGRVPAAEVPRWAARFDVALQPAANPYASPLKLVEYMALGHAIVAPDQPNIREMVTHERDALLFAPDNAAAFNAAVRRLAQDAALRARLGAAALDAVRRRELTWAHNARRVLELARELVRGQASAATAALTRTTPR